jgi:hypothetical protein
MTSAKMFVESARMFMELPNGFVALAKRFIKPDENVYGISEKAGGITERFMKPGENGFSGRVNHRKCGCGRSTPALGWFASYELSEECSGLKPHN